MTFSVLPTPDPSTPNKASRLPARNEQDRQIPDAQTVHTSNLTHRLNFLAHFVGWHDNPFARRIEAGLWADLACRVPRFMAGLDPDVDYPELRGRL